MKNSFKNTVIGVDPGLSGTGYAIFKDKEYVMSGTVTTDSSESKELWEKRASLIAERLKIIIKTLIDNDCTTTVYIEYANYRESNMGQMVARRGDLGKLFFLTGLIVGYLAPIQCVLVPVINWKGTLPKAVTQQRVRRALGPVIFKGMSSHAYDAAGIALYAMEHC